MLHLRFLAFSAMELISASVFVVSIGAIPSGQDIRVYVAVRFQLYGSITAPLMFATVRRRTLTRRPREPSSIFAPDLHRRPLRKHSRSNVASLECCSRRYKTRHQSQDTNGNSDPDDSLLITCHRPHGTINCTDRACVRLHLNSHLGHFLAPNFDKRRFHFDHPSRRPQ